MNAAIIALIFFLALGLTLTRGAGVAFALVYLPTLLLLNQLRPFPLPGLTDPTADVAAVYGIMLGLLPRLGERLPIRWNALDWIMVALVGSRVLTAMTTHSFYGGISTGSGLMVTMLLPYLLARAAVADAAARQIALKVLVGCGIAFGLMAAIEARLWPYYFSRLMISAGLFDSPGELVYYRYGLFRARVMFIHPIDFGNVAIEMLGMLLFFAATIQGALRRPSVQLAAVALLGGAMLSISYTAFVALGMGVATFLVVRNGTIQRNLVWVAVIGLLGGVAVSMYLLQINVAFDEKGLAEASLMNRAMIMQHGLPVALDAGPFGFGNNVDMERLKIESIDNSYLLSLISYGWVYLLLMLAIPLAMCWGASRAFRSPQGRARPLPLVLLVTTTLAIMVAMYTVWFGFAYAIIFMLILGLTNGTIQLYCQAPAPAPLPAGQPLRWRAPLATGGA